MSALHQPLAHQAGKAGSKRRTHRRLPFPPRRVSELHGHQARDSRDEEQSDRRDEDGERRPDFGGQHVTCRRRCDCDFPVACEQGQRQPPQECRALARVVRGFSRRLLRARSARSRASAGKIYQALEACPCQRREPRSMGSTPESGHLERRNPWA